MSRSQKTASNSSSQKTASNSSSQKTASSSSSSSHTEPPTVINLLITTHGGLPEMQTRGSARSNVSNSNIMPKESISARYPKIRSLTLNNIMVNETNECSSISEQDMFSNTEQVKKVFSGTGTIFSEEIVELLNSQQEGAKESLFQSDVAVFGSTAELYQAEKKVYNSGLEYAKFMEGFNKKYPESAAEIPAAVKPKRPYNPKPRKSTYVFQMYPDMDRIMDKRYDFDTRYSSTRPFTVLCEDRRLARQIEQVIYTAQSHGPKTSMYQLLLSILAICDSFNKTDVVINIVDTSCNNLQSVGNARMTASGDFETVLKGGKKYRKTRKYRKYRKTRKSRKSRKSRK